jgi:hypothetical protein
LEYDWEKDKCVLQFAMTHNDPSRPFNMSIQKLTNLNGWFGVFGEFLYRPMN